MLCLLKLDYEHKIDDFMMAQDFSEMRRKAEGAGLSELAQYLYARESPMDPTPGNHGIVFTDSNECHYQLLVD